MVLRWPADADRIFLLSIFWDSGEEAKGNVIILNRHSDFIADWAHCQNISKVYSKNFLSDTWYRTDKISIQVFVLEKDVIFIT